MRRVARAALAVLFMAAVLWLVDVRAVLALLRGVEPFWLVLAGCLLVAQTALSALRWRVTAARLGQEIGAGRALREYFLAQSVNLALPGGVLGDAGRALRAREDVGLLRAGQAVVLERLAGQAALVAVMVAAVLCVTLVPGGLRLPAALLALLAGLVLVPGALALWSLRAVRAGGGPGWMADWAGAARRALLAGDVWRIQAGLSLAAVAANLLAFAACAAAVGVTLSPGAITVILPMVLFSMLVPLTVGGWGLREGAAAALFPLAGATAAEGVAASAAFGATFTVVSLAGLFLHLRPQAGVGWPSGGRSCLMQGENRNEGEGR